jgi:hypothetical protein
VFWIKGPAGIGKSTISGMLCNEFAANIVGVHFCQHNDMQRKSVRNVITSLAYQLSLRVPAYGKVLDAQLKENPTFDARNDDIATVINTLLIEPLGAVDAPLDGMSDEQKEGQRGDTDFVKLVLLIDALDESEQSGANALLDFLRDKVGMLPAWLAVVVTSRPKTEIVAALAKYAPLKIECGSTDNRNDIVRFVTHKVHELMGTGADNEEAVQLLCDKAEGVFVYVAKVFEHHRTLSIEDVRALPKGMAAFVLASMERVRVQWEVDKKDDTVEAEWDDVMQCLRIVLAAREPLTVAALVELVDGVVFQEDVERFVDALASLFPLRKTGDDFDVIVPYHKSVPDALTDEAVKKKQRSNELRYRRLSFVDLAAGNALLSTACLRVLRSSDATDGDGDCGAFVLSVERALAAADETHKSVRYAVRHAGEHLVAVGCFQDAAMLLCNLQMIELRVALESDNGGLRALLHEYFRLAEALNKARDGNGVLTTRVDEYIRFVRAHRTALRDAPKQTDAYAFNFPSKTTVCLDVRALKSWWETRSDWIEWTNKVEAFTPVVMSIEHPKMVSSVVYSPDKSKLLSTCDDGMRLFDAKSGQEERQFEGHIGQVNSAAFSSDGKSIVSASGDNTVRVWNASTGEQVHDLNGHTGAVYSAAFSSDGQSIVSASDETTVRVWNASTGEQVHELKEHTRLMNSAAFSSDGQSIVSALGTRRCAFGTPALDSRCTSSRDTQLL